MDRRRIIELLRAWGWGFHPVAFAFLLVGAVPVVAAEADDRAVFENRCAACHGADGRARTPQGRKIKAKDLRESRLTPAEIERQIREGSRGKTGISVMPAVGKDMPDAEIQAAVRVVLGFRAAAAAPP